jgi:RecA/RadA recombinase
MSDADLAADQRKAVGDVERAFRDGASSSHDGTLGDPIGAPSTTPERVKREQPEEETSPDGFRPGVKLRRLDTVGPPQRVEWLEGAIAQGRIPRGEMTLLFGEPGVGKGSISAQIVAEVTAAGRSVLISCPEDDLTRITVPRYMAAKVDMSLVHEIALWETEDDSLPVDLFVDADIILRQAEETNAALIILDPIEEHLRADVKNETANRDALRKLVKGCRKLGVAVLAVDHPNRMNSQSLFRKAGGNSAKYKIARSALYAGRQASPEDETAEQKGNRVALIHGKHNMMAPAPGLLFDVRTEWVQGDESEPISTGYAELLGTTTVSMEALLSDETQALHTDIGEAAAWLQLFLEENGLGMVAEEVERNAIAINPAWTRKVLRPAVSSLGGKYAALAFRGRYGYRLPGFIPLGENIT